MTVQVSAGVTITVTGTGVLQAKGTPAQHIRFTRVPPSGGNWGSLDFINAPSESRIEYADFECHFCAVAHVRLAPILGFVGGGGIGLDLYQSINLSQYGAAGLIIFMIVVTVATMDFVSAQIRKRLV